jgi:translation initiation factor IF-2
MATLNQLIDFETASLVADEFGYELELEKFKEEIITEDIEDKPEQLKARPPVVTIMGHVDHGKTSLLDFIRQSNIIEGESGGITQHIGAYYVKSKGGDIVFLDTPGHEAFTAMRARGAKVTDIIILVVAADDGVMPQTKEAVNHARAAEIPIIVAINKIDKPDSDPDKVTRELSEIGLAPEEWGGDTIFGKISAKTGEGVEELMELILLQSEMLELKANPDKPARGTIIEARLDKNKGSLATVLIKGGTLNQSDHFICGGTYGRVRAMTDHRGRKMESAGPSVPVEVYGISGVPMAGDEFIVVKDEKSARQLGEYRQAQIKAKDIARRGIVSLDDLFDKIKEGEIKELNIVLKADVQGSLEALSDSLIKLSTEEVKLKMIHASTGAISETDVMLASASGAIVIGFNVRANPRVRKIAEKEKVDIRYYDVIYNALEDIRLAMEGLLEPVYKEQIIGRADIKEIFNVPKVGTVAGCYVTDGHIERNAKVRLLRDDVVVFDGNISSLRRFKEDVKEVQSGYECGMGLEGYQDIKPGDVFEVYKLEEIQAEL